MIVPLSEADLLMNMHAAWRVNYPGVKWLLHIFSGLNSLVPGDWGFPDSVSNELAVIKKNKLPHK